MGSGEVPRIAELCIIGDKKLSINLNANSYENSNKAKFLDVVVVLRDNMFIFRCIELLHLFISLGSLDCNGVGNLSGSVKYELLFNLNAEKQMKRYILMIAFLVEAATTFAQYDSKFYNPQKECFPMDSIMCKSAIELINGDSIFILKAYPEGKVKATVFLYHGNSGNLTNEAAQKLLKLLTDSGYQVFAFDYPGFGYSTGTPTHKNIAEDAAYLFSRWISDKEVAGTPVIVYGQSIGAQVASMLTAGNESQVKTLILDGCSPSFTALAEQFTPEEYHPYVRKSVISPYSVEQSVGKLKDVKVLYIHSKTDAIPYAGAQAMYELTNSPKSFWTYEGKHLEAASMYPDRFISELN